MHASVVRKFQPIHLPPNKVLAQAVIVIQMSVWVRDIMCYKSDGIFILSPRGLVISGNRAELR